MSFSMWIHKHSPGFLYLRCIISDYGMKKSLVGGCWCQLHHDDVIKWEHFPRYWPFVREFTGPGEFPAQRSVTRSFDVFFDLRLNKRLSKQPWGWWFETPSWSLWRQCNDGWYKYVVLHITPMRNITPVWNYFMPPQEMKILLDD